MKTHTFFERSICILLILVTLGTVFPTKFAFAKPLSAPVTDTRFSNKLSEYHSSGMENLTAPSSPSFLPDPLVDNRPALSADFFAPARSAWASLFSAPFNSCTDVTEIPQAECEALVALYSSTGGADNLWLNDTGWLQTNTPCSWYGISCAGGHVTGLGLDHNTLAGFLPLEMGNLPELQYIFLQVNKLTGSIPSGMCSLTALKGLSLSTNILTGNIPDCIGNWTGLLYFDLSANQFTGSIPEGIGNWTGIQSLYLHGNQLTGSIPETIGNLTELKYLRISDNQLTGSIPHQFGNLLNLQILDLNTNQLTGEIPAEIWGLTSLTLLQLNGNQLTGVIPDDIGNLTNLEELYLNNNQLSGQIPPKIGELKVLRILYLQNNQLAGSIPPEIGDLTSLRLLFLGCNQFTGSIPPEIGNLLNLEVLALYVNKLSGNIPAEIGSLPSLKSLQLDKNQLTGSIPEELGNLINLEGLYLSYNQLGGQIPSTIGNLHKLEYLYLERNRLGGSIPLEIRNLTLLRIVHLQVNEFEGSIPAGIGDLSQLEYLRLDGNKLTGAIPAEMGNLHQLGYLSLANNQLTGNLPSTFGNLDVLQTIYLHNNYLSGIIPNFIPGDLLDALFQYNCGFSAYDPTQAVWLDNADPLWQVRNPTCPATLTVTKTGSGTGAITSAPAGIECGADCSEVYPYNTQVTLTPTANPGSIFVGWTGCDSVNGNQCLVTMTADKTVTANFAIPYTLTVQTIGAGNGIVTSVPAGINCDPTCSAVFAENTDVKLTATPAPGYRFFKWLGACANYDSNLVCDVTMDQEKSVKALFLKEHALNGGFETYTAKSPRIPADWLPSNNYSAADGKDTTTKLNDRASMKITGATGKTKSLTQTQSLSGKMGDTFLISFWAKGNNLPVKGLCQVEFRFYNGKSAVGTPKILPCNFTGTFAFKQVFLPSFTAPDIYDKVSFTILYSKSSGTVWFDAVSLLSDAVSLSR